MSGFVRLLLKYKGGYNTPTLPEIYLEICKSTVILLDKRYKEQTFLQSPYITSELLSIFLFLFAASSPLR